jgi:hypothetical protein
MELEAHASYRGPDDPADASGQHLLVGRSVDEDSRQVAYNAGGGVVVREGLR